MPIEQDVTVLKLSYYQSKARSTYGWPMCKLEDTSPHGNIFKCSCPLDNAFRLWFEDIFPDHPPLETRKYCRPTSPMILEALNALGYHVEMLYGADVIVIIKKGAI